MTWRAPFSCTESSKASHTERTGPPAIPQYLWTKQLQWGKTKLSKTKPLSVFSECGSTSYPDARPHMEVQVWVLLHYSPGCQVWLLGIYRWSGSPARWRQVPGWLWPLLWFEGVWSDPPPMDTEDEHCGGCTECSLHLETYGIYPFTTPYIFLFNEVLCGTKNNRHTLNKKCTEK